MHDCTRPSGRFAAWSNCGKFAASRPRPPTCNICRRVIPCIASLRKVGFIVHTNPTRKRGTSLAYASGLYVQSLPRGVAPRQPLDKSTVPTATPIDPAGVLRIQYLAEGLAG